MMMVGCFDLEIFTKMAAQTIILSLAPQMFCFDEKSKVNGNL